MPSLRCFSEFGNFFGIILFYLLGVSTSANAQNAEFNISDNLCIDQKVTISNSSTNSISSYWDFCSGDFWIEPSASNTLTNSIFNQTFSLKSIKEGNYYYVILSDFSNNKLTVLSFKDSLTAQPVETSIEDPLIDGPIGFDLIKYDEEWYGFLANFNSNEVLRFAFGSSLANTPLVDQLTASVNLKNPAGLQAVAESDSVFLVVANGSNSESSFTIFEIGHPASNINDENFYISPFGSRLRGLSIDRIGDDYVGFIASSNNSDLVRLDIPSSITGSPTISNEQSLTYSNTTSVDLQYEGGQLHAWIIQRNGMLHRLSFQVNSNNIQDQITIGNLGVLTNNTFSLSIAGDSSKYYGVTNDFNNNRFFVIDFPNICSSNVAISDKQNPDISYSQEGLKRISLRATSGLGIDNYHIDSSSVSSNIAPPISFSVNASNCVANSNLFTANISGLTYYSWDFNEDGIEDSNEENPIVRFDTLGGVGSYMVRLDVNDGTCDNFYEEEITIYPEPPTPSFNVTSSGTLCTNNELMLINTTDETGYDNVLTYQWVIDGDIANQKDTVYTFLSSGVKTITLQSFVPGCSSTLASQDFTIDDGPEVSFNYINNCFGEPIQFTSEVIGADITDYIWNFGDGEGTSSQVDTTYQYSLAGIYMVQLTVTNASGCSTVYSEEIEVNDGPLADFTVGEAIENLPTEFSGLDLTISNDSIIGWNWDFGGLGTSSSKNTSFIFDEGDFMVSLSISTAQGCDFQIDKMITVLSSSCPSSSFNYTSNLCREELMDLNNLSANSINYVWDFCSGELDSLPSAFLLQSNLDYNDAFDIEIIRDQNLWYGFVSSQNNLGSVLRLSYGDSLRSIPESFSLPNNSGIINHTGFTVYQYGEEWYGLMINVVDNRLVRYSFGESLLNNPSEELFENIGLFEGNNDITSVVDSDSIFVFVATNDIGSVLRLRYKGSNPSTINADTISIAGYTEINDIQLIRECDSWYGLITSFADSKVSKLSFGTSLSSTPSLTNITGSFSSATKAELVVDGGDYYGFVQLRGGDLIRLDFGSSMVNMPDVVNLGNLGVLSSNSFAFSMGKDNSKWTAFGIGFTNNNLYQIVFPDDCSASIAESEDFEPKGVSYSTSGRKYITLKATDAEGHVNYYLDSVEVSTNVAPAIAYSFNSSRCVTNTNIFTPTISGLTSYSWDFDGDGIEDSNAENPQVLYDTLGGPGTYTVRVDVSDGTCDNFYEEEITIYPEPPTPSFDSTFPSLCENVTFNFTNTIDSSGYDTLLRYRWFLNGTQIASDYHLAYSFDSPGEKIIGLQSYIPGCESVIVQDTFNIPLAPHADFQADTICLSETLILTNNSSNASTYNWNFGDGETSVLFEPTKVYADTGTYQVSLDAIDSSGDCMDTQIRTVRVNRNPPIPSFNVESIPLCVGSEINLSNTTNDNSFNSEVTYQWIISDLGIFSDKNLTVSFTEPGEKTIQLQSIYRTCESTVLEQIIDVRPLPTPNFTATSVCQGEVMQFTNESADAVSYLWDFGDGFTSTSDNPSHVYTTAGNYNVSLTATSSDGCDNEIVIEVSVADIPQVSFDFEVPCSSESGVAFMDLSTVNNADIVGWQWFVEGVEVSAEQNPTLNFNETGVINVSLAVTSSNGCESTYNEDIEILPSPSPDFLTAVGCIGEETMFDDMTTSSTNIISWLWFIDGVSYTTQNVSHVFDDYGSYEVSLEVTSQNFCAESITKTIEILQPPTMDFSIAGDCDNELIEVQDLSTQFNDPIISRTWRLDSEIVGNGTLLYLNELESASYQLTLEVETESGCVTSMSQILEINSSPTSSFTPSRTFGLPNDRLTFTNTSSGASSFQWLLNGEQAGNDPDFETYQFAEVGTHLVELVAQNSLGCVDTTRQEVLIAIPEVDLSIGSFELVQENNTGKIFLEIQNFSNLPVESFEVKIILENQFTVTEQINRLIDIGASELVSLNVGIPVVTSEPAYFCVSLSSPYAEYDDINLLNNEKCLTIQPKVRVEDPFPNPVSDEFRLKVIVPNDGAVKLTLINSAGKVQTERTYNASQGLNNFIFDMSLLDPGIYYVTVNIDGTIIQRKVIKL